MTINHVNIQFFELILSPLAALGDDPSTSEPFIETDIDNPIAVKEIFEKYLKKEFYENSEVAIQKSKLALSFYLTTEYTDFKRLFDSYMLPFVNPSNPRLFFIWLWEVLFPNESYLLSNANIYTEIDDLNEVIRIYAPNWKGPL